MEFMVLKMLHNIFHGKSAKELDLNESSMLAGVVNGPTYYSPLNDAKAARKRQSIVLKRSNRL